VCLAITVAEPTIIGLDCARAAVDDPGGHRYRVESLTPGDRRAKVGRALVLGQQGGVWP